MEQCTFKPNQKPSKITDDKREQFFERLAKPVKKIEKVEKIEK